MLYYAGQKILAVIVCQFKKKKCNLYFIVIMITVLIMNVIFWVVNFKTQNYFVIYSFLLHRTFTSGYLCTIALILFIHVGFLEYLSFKQFKLIVKMTRIESGVTIPKGLFTLYLNVKKEGTKYFGRHSSVTSKQINVNQALTSSQ
jgi:hypothetical protein